jgi:hypothetical protein
VELVNVPYRHGGGGGEREYGGLPGGEYSYAALGSAVTLAASTA